MLDERQQLRRHPSPGSYTSYAQPSVCKAYIRHMDEAELARSILEFGNKTVAVLVPVGDQHASAPQKDFVAICGQAGAFEYIGVTIAPSSDPDDGDLLVSLGTGQVVLDALSPGAAELARQVLETVGANARDPEANAVIASLAGVPKEIIEWAQKVLALPPDILGLLTLEEFNGRDTLTVSEVAARLGVSTDAIYDVIRAGELATVRFNRRFLIPVESYVDFYNAHYRASRHEDPFA